MTVTSGGGRRPGAGAVSPPQCDPEEHRRQQEDGGREREEPAREPERLARVHRPAPVEKALPQRRLPRVVHGEDARVVDGNVGDRRSEHAAKLAPGNLASATEIARSGLIRPAPASRTPEGAGGAASSSSSSASSKDCMAPADTNSSAGTTSRTPAARCATYTRALPVNRCQRARLENHCPRAPHASLSPSARFVTRSRPLNPSSQRPR